MLTPLDIQNKEFTKQFRGYTKIEVDMFLDQAIKTFENIYRENVELKSQIEILNQEIEHYTSIEDAIQKTLVLAQTTSEEVIETAKQEGDLLIEDSNIQAKEMIENAEKEVSESKQEYQRIKNEILKYKEKYRALLEEQLKKIDHSDKDNNISDILEEMEENEPQETAVLNEEDLDESEDLYTESLEKQVQDIYGSTEQQSEKEKNIKII